MFDDNEIEQCEICGGPVGLLGILGNRLHQCCRDCGAHSSRIVTDEDRAAFSGAEQEV